MSKAVKMYDWARAPNPKRLRMYLAERGIDIPKEEVHVGSDGSGSMLSESFRKKYPRATVPAVELNDGTIIGDAAACMRYFEKAYTSTPSLFGKDAKDAALVDQWEHAGYEDCLMAAAESFRNSKMSKVPYPVPGLPGTEKNEALVARGKQRLAHFYVLLENQLEGKEFICGDFFSAADITTFCGVQFASAVCRDVPLEGKNCKAWFERVSGRPSSKM